MSQPSQATFPAPAKLPSQPQVSAPAPVPVVKQKTVKQRLAEFLTENKEKFPKNATLNSLVQRYQARYPDFIASLNLPKQEINVADTESISGYNPEYDDYKSSEPSVSKGKEKEVEVNNDQEVDDDLLFMIISRLETIEAKMDSLELGGISKGKKLVITLE